MNAATGEQNPLVDNPVVRERVGVALALAGKSLAALAREMTYSKGAVWRVFAGMPRTHADLLQELRAALGDEAWGVLIGDIDVITLPRPACGEAPEAPAELRKCA